MELEIKVMWCKGLTGFNFFQKLTVYAVASITSEDQRVQLTQDQKQEQKTPVDQEGDGDPEWNHAIKFDLRPLKSISSDFNELSILFEFRHQGQLFGDKVIGQVRVPVKSLLDSVGSEFVRFVSYEVRNPEGKHNGIFDFSYKVLRDVVSHEIVSSSVNQEMYISGYQYQHHVHWDHSHSNNDHGSHSESNMIGHVMYHSHHSNQQISSSDPERIQYPKIDPMDGWGNSNHGLVPSAQHLAGGNQNESAPQVHCQEHPPPVVYPSPQQHLWASPHPHPPHFPPPPHVVYPPPPHEDPHWGYHRPPECHQQGGGYDQYHHW